MRKIILLLLTLSAIAFAYISEPIYTEYAETSFVTDSTVTIVSKPFRLGSEATAYVLTNLSGGVATLFNNYQVWMNGSWVIVHRDTLSAVGFKKFSLRADNDAVVPGSDIRIQSVITNSSGTQTLTQRIEGY